MYWIARRKKGKQKNYPNLLNPFKPVFEDEKLPSPAMQYAFEHDDAPKVIKELVRLGFGDGRFKITHKGRGGLFKVEVFDTADLGLFY